MPAQASFHQEGRIAAIIGLLLLASTYLVFSIRAVTDPWEPGQILDLKRFAAAGVGAVMFWLVARHARRNWAGQVHARIVSLALMTVWALGLVLATRIAYDMFLTELTDESLVRNVRWTMIWLGYFGAALLGYFAVVCGLTLQRSPQLARGTHEDRVAAVFTEIATWSAADKRMLVAAFDTPTVYEEADPLSAIAKDSASR